MVSYEFFLNNVEKLSFLFFARFFKKLTSKFDILNIVIGTSNSID